MSAVSSSLEPDWAVKVKGYMGEPPGNTIGDLDSLAPIDFESLNVDDHHPVVTSMMRESKREVSERTTAHGEDDKHPHTYEGWVGDFGNLATSSHEHHRSRESVKVKGEEGGRSASNKWDFEEILASVGHHERVTVDESDL